MVKVSIPITSSYSWLFQ